MSKILVDEIAPKTAGKKVLMPPGGIIQLQYTQLNTAATQAFLANTDTAFTDLTVNITPTSTSSIIKIECHLAGEFDDDDITWDHAMFFFRDTTHPVSYTHLTLPTNREV